MLEINGTGLTALRLRPGDRVRFVSPASPPERIAVARGAEILSSWGLRVELGAHVFDTMGHYLAGSDEDRLADINEAIRDPGLRAIFSTRGGKGSYRIAHALDFEAMSRDPKPLVGFSDITILHVALWHRCRVAGFMALTLDGVTNITGTQPPTICAWRSWTHYRLSCVRIEQKSPRTW